MLISLLFGLAHVDANDSFRSPEIRDFFTKEGKVSVCTQQALAQPQVLSLGSLVSPSTQNPNLLFKLDPDVKDVHENHLQQLHCCFFFL